MGDNNRRKTQDIFRKIARSPGVEPNQPDACVAAGLRDPKKCCAMLFFGANTFGGYDECVEVQ